MSIEIIKVRLYKFNFEYFICSIGYIFFFFSFRSDVKDDWKLKLIPASDFELSYYTPQTDFGNVDEAMASKILHSVASQLILQRE